MVCDRESEEGWVRVLGEAACVSGMVVLGGARLVAVYDVHGRFERVHVESGLIAWGSPF